MKKINPKDVEKYVILLNMKIKLGLVIIAVIILLVLFIFFLIFLCKEKNLLARILGGVTSIYIIRISPVFKHYFK